MDIKTSGTPFAGPGIYSGVTNADYHAGPGVSKSQLDLLARSPLHFWARYVSLAPIASVETAAMRLGTAVHCAVLEPEEFMKWVVMDKVDRRFKEGKAAAAEAEALAAERGVPLIDATEHHLVTNIAAAVNMHPDIGPILESGIAELSIYWTDPDTGILCRCRPDWLGAGVVLDVKTTENASPKSFVRSAYDYRYWVQAAFYLDGLAANDVLVDNFIFAAVEKSPPHAVMGYRATEDLIAAGRREYKRLLTILKDCSEADEWPGYGGVTALDLPGYANERFTMSDGDAFASDTESV